MLPSSQDLGESLDALDTYVLFTANVRQKFINAGFTPEGAETMTLEVLRMGMTGSK